jgi:hypothetical protein
VPFPAGERADPRASHRPDALVRAAAAAKLVAFPAGAVASEYVGTGTAGYVTSALAGVACAAAARSAGGRGWRLAAMAAGYAVLAVALGYRLVPGGADPLPTSPAAAGGYLAAAAGALAWAAPGRRAP